MKIARNRWGIICALVLFLFGVANAEDSMDWKIAVNLLSLVDPERDTVCGVWTLKNGELSSGSGVARIQIPYEPPEEYDFRIVFTRSGGGDNVYQIFSRKGRAASWSMGAYGNKFFGFEAGVRAWQTNSTFVEKDRCLENGRAYTSVLRVRKDGVQALVDGRLLCSWKTDYQDARLAFSIPDQRLLAVGSWNSPTIFHKIELLAITGKGVGASLSPRDHVVKPIGTDQKPDAVVTRMVVVPSAMAREITNSIGMRLILVDPMKNPGEGRFLMGSATDELGRDGMRRDYFSGSSYASNPLPVGDQERQHRVRLRKPYYLGATEVTQDQWDKVMGAKPGPRRADGPDYPVAVPGYLTADFMRKLSAAPEEKSDCRVYRLPTEAEWEYACRAGSTTAYCYGDDADKLSDYAWFKDNSGRKPHPVAQKRPNAWGFFDMHGNLQEWCRDLYALYPSEEQTDPVAEVIGSAYDHGDTIRVVRGGSCLMPANECRSAWRFRNPTRTSWTGIGFRVVCEVTAAPASAPATSAATATMQPPKTGVAFSKEVTPVPPRVPTNIVNATGPVKPLAPVLQERIRNMPPFWSYVAFADATGSVDLNGVFDTQNLRKAEPSVMVKQVRVKLLMALTDAGWDGFPNAEQNGQEITLVARDVGHELQFYSKLSHWATLNTRTFRFTRGANAPWKHVALSFHKENGVFQVLVLERPVTMPWPSLAVPRVRGLEATGRGQNRLSLKTELAGQLRMRTALSPYETAWRIGASGLAELAKSYPKEVASAQRAIMVDARGQATGEAILDWAALVVSIGGHRESVAPPKVPVEEPEPQQPIPGAVTTAASIPLPAPYEVYAKHKELDGMGAWLLGEQCPMELQSFHASLEGLADRLPADSWSTYVDYLGLLLEATGALCFSPVEVRKSMRDDRERLYTYRFADVPPDTQESPLAGKPSAPVTGAAPDSDTQQSGGREIHTDPSLRSRAEALERFQLLRKRLARIKLHPEEIRSVAGEFNLVIYHLERAALSAVRDAETSSATELRNNVERLKAISKRWNTRFQDDKVMNYIQRSRVTQPNTAKSTPRVNPSDASETRRVGPVMASIQQDPKRVPDLGKMTLEMEVAPGVWWPVIVFTEDGK